MIITNVVYSANLLCTFNLRKLCYQLTNVRYEPKRFPGLIWQHPHIGGNCLIFGNGNINCNGKARYFREGRERLRKYARCLQRLGYKMHVTRLKRLTVSAYHKLSSPLRLEQIAKEWSLSYTPEIFPTLVFKKGVITFSCFHSGAVIITGIKQRHHIDDIIYPTLIELELYTM